MRAHREQIRVHIVSGATFDNTGRSPGSLLRSDASRPSSTAVAVQNQTEP